MVDITVEDGRETAPSDTTEIETDAWATEQVVTPIVSLKARRAEIIKYLYKDIQVPRWDNPEIFVRFNPVDVTELNEAVNRRRKQGLKDWPQRANADVLINACVGVYAVFPDSPDVKLSLREGDPYGEWTKFDKALAEALGIEVTDGDAAVATARGLYMTDGDLGDTTERLLKFSNLSNEQADETF